MEQKKEDRTEFQIITHNIAWLRRNYGISRKKMAKLLGIGIRSLDKIEKGEIPPRLKVNIFFAVHKHFGISPYVLLTQWMEDK